MEADFETLNFNKMEKEKNVKLKTKTLKFYHL